MSATTSLKLPDALKATTAKVDAFDGKTAHALMLDTLQAAMDDALMRQQFYGDGEASYSATMRTNPLIFDALDILVQHTEIGRKVHFGQRELVISRGRTGYLALYQFLPHVNRIVVLALRPQRESGYA